MENFQITTVVQWLSSMIGAVTAIAAAVLSVSKKARQGVKNLIRRDTNVDEIKVELNGINTELISMREAIGRIEEENGRQREAHLAELRNGITGIYYKHLDDRKLAAYEKEDMLKMYDVYAKWNGNSYVHTIVKEMTDWNVEA